MRPLKVGIQLLIVDHKGREAGRWIKHVSKRQPQLPIVERTGREDTPLWDDISLMARRAEEVGFDSLWAEDHLLFRREGQEPQGVWEGWSMLAAIAAVTSRIEIGPLVACASFRNPALLAKMADTVDEISGGRLILGLGAGWHEPEYRAFGFPFDHRVSRFEEALQIIHGLLKQRQVDFDGQYYQARDCELLPRGPRPDGPPIMIGSVGDRMLRLTARYADMWNAYFPHTSNRAANIPALREQVDAACREVGRDPATLQRTASILVDMAPDRRASEPLGPPGRSWDFDPLSGPPEEIAEDLRRYAAEGISHIQLCLDPTTLASIEAFAPVLEQLDR